MELQIETEPNCEEEDHEDQLEDDDSMDSGEDSDASYKENENLRNALGHGSSGVSKAFCKGHWSKEEVRNFYLIGY